MQDPRVAGLATALTVAAIADTLLPTPEDLWPILGWVDETILWGLSAKLWISFLEGRKLEEIFVWKP
ncbi:MAG: hypothetical protein ACXQS2_00285 [Methermicoccaceae archaeon]